MRGDREGQTHVHSARVVLHWRVDETIDLGKCDDLVELARDLGVLHAEDRSVQIRVLAAGEIPVEAGANLEQRADPSRDLCEPRGRIRNSGEHLQQRRLPRAVATDDSDGITGGNLERDVAKSPQNVAVRNSVFIRSTADEAPACGGDRVARRAEIAPLSEAVLLSELVGANRWYWHYTVPMHPLWSRASFCNSTSLTGRPRTCPRHDESTRARLRRRPRPRPPTPRA